MAAQKGREILIQRDSGGATFVTIGGMRQKSMQLNDQFVDTTASDSAGRWREGLAAAGVRSMSVSGGGVFKDSAAESAIVADFMAGLNPTLQFVVPGLGTFSGAFHIDSWGAGGQHDNELGFNISFSSAGEITFA